MKKLTVTNVSKFIHHSNAIEGIYYNEKQVLSIIKHLNSADYLNRKILINNRYIVNHQKAIDYIKEHKNEQMSLYHICRLHSILMNDLMKDAGIIRTGPVTVGNHIPPRAEVIHYALEHWVNMWGKSPVKSWSKKKACLFRHYEFEHIHPFWDGNGRVGRLLYLWDCLQNNTSHDIIEVDQRQEYYNDLDQYRSQFRDKYLHEWR